MDNASIIVAGSGKMAQEVFRLCKEQQRNFFHLDNLQFPNEGMAGIPIVHLGSGRQLKECLDVCMSIQAPLIQGSTGQSLPQEVLVPIVIAPNLSFAVIKMVAHILPILKRIYSGASITIVESHQAMKKSISGTALMMADALGITKEDITSVRDPVIQRQLGVTEENLDGHAYHWINVMVHGVNVSVSIKVNGRRPYAEGVLAIADALVKNRERFEPRIYGIDELLDFMI